MSPVLLTPVKSLSLVSTTPAINIKLWIFFVKIREMTPIGYSWVRGENDSWKNLKSKFSCQNPSNRLTHRTKSEQRTGMGVAGGGGQSACSLDAILWKILCYLIADLPAFGLCLAILQNIGRQPCNLQTLRYHEWNISWRTAKALFCNILWFSDNLWRRKNDFDMQILYMSMNKKWIGIVSYKSQFFPFETKQTVDNANLHQKRQKSNSFWKQKDRKRFGYFSFQGECHATSWVTGCKL